MPFPDLIFVSLENWDEVWRRNQFLCSRLARRFPDSKILFVGLSRNVSNALRQRDFSSLRGAETWQVPGYDNITVTRPLKLAPNTWEPGRQLNERMFRAHVARVAAAMGMRRPLLWLNPHDAGHMAGRMGECAAIYDITDDWALGTLSEREKRVVQAQDRHLCRRADLVVVCSQALYESRRPLCKRILLLPNGVDVEHYRNTTCDEDKKRGKIEPPSAPVFGYTGTLHDDRIDADLVIALARAFPQGCVRLVGPDYLEDATKARLMQQPNIEIPGPVPYADIPQMMQTFDVCIVPHLESAFTESLNPIKLWEYLAVGKPIASSNVAGFRDYPSLVHLASGPDKFVEACRHALQEDNEACQARRAEAALNSWDARLEQLLEELKQLRGCGTSD